MGRRNRNKTPEMVAKNRRPKMGFLSATAPQVMISRDLFLETFMKNLVLAKNKYPEIYTWAELNILEVFRGYVETLENGTFTKHVHAIKWTCRELKIENDRETIQKIFTSGAE